MTSLTESVVDQAGQYIDDLAARLDRTIAEVRPECHRGTHGERAKLAARIVYDWMYAVVDARDVAAWTNDDAAAK